MRRLVFILMMLINGCSAQQAKSMNWAVLSLEHLLQHPRVVAVGEMGLDFFVSEARGSVNSVFFQSQPRKSVIITPLSCMIGRPTGRPWYANWTSDVSHQQPKASRGWFVSLFLVGLMRRCSALLLLEDTSPFSGIMWPLKCWQPSYDS